jgi:hypothetical protein
VSLDVSPGFWRSCSDKSSLIRLIPHHFDLAVEQASGHDEALELAGSSVDLGDLSRGPR